MNRHMASPPLLVAAAMLSIALPAVSPAVAEEPAPAEQPKWARTALLASRTNTMLSIPVLFFMVVARHLPSLWGV